MLSEVFQFISNYYRFKISSNSRFNGFLINTMTLQYLFFIFFNCLFCFNQHLNYLIIILFYANIETIIVYLDLCYY